ncbi:phosphopantetheine-binding protein [Streptomyces stramineus]
MTRVGIESVLPHEAFETVEEFLTGGLDVAGTGRYNWTTLHALLQSMSAPRHTGLVPALRTRTAPTRQEIIAELSAMAPEDAERLIADSLAQVLADVLQTPVEQIDHHRRLDTYGVDSLMATEVLTSLRKQYDVDIPPMELLRSNGTVADIARIIHLRLGLATTSAGGLPPGREPQALRRRRSRRRGGRRTPVAGAGRIAVRRADPVAPDPGPGATGATADARPRAGTALLRARADRRAPGRTPRGGRPPLLPHHAVVPPLLELPQLRPDIGPGEGEHHLGDPGPEAARAVVRPAHLTAGGVADHPGERAVARQLAQDPAGGREAGVPQPGPRRGGRVREGDEVSPAGLAQEGRPVQIDPQGGLVGVDQGESPGRQAASPSTSRSSAVWKNSVLKALSPGTAGRAAITAAALSSSRAPSGCPAGSMPLMLGASKASENQSEYGWWEGCPSTIRPLSINPLTW